MLLPLKLKQQLQHARKPSKPKQPVKSAKPKLFAIVNAGNVNIDANRMQEATMNADGLNFCFPPVPPPHLLHPLC